MAVFNRDSELNGDLNDLCCHVEEVYKFALQLIKTNLQPFAIKSITLPLQQ